MTGATGTKEKICCRIRHQIDEEYNYQKIPASIAEKERNRRLHDYAKGKRPEVTANDFHFAFSSPLSPKLRQMQPSVQLLADDLVYKEFRLTIHRCASLLKITLCPCVS